jgi:hypothetical protein
VLTTTPLIGATQIPLDSPITIEFSEAIDRKTAAKAIFIAPQPDPEPKFKIKSRSIIITPQENLRPNRTYVVTLGTDLKDAHRVNLAQSVNIAFSTGSTIDTGSISGTVFQDDKRTAGVSLALFENDPEQAGLPIDSLVPDYITQSGENGAFAFSYLSPARYYLVAYSDKNKDRRINTGREMFGLPYDYAAVDSATPAIVGIDIQLHMQDTSIIGLRTVSVNPDQLIKIRFNKPLEESEAGELFGDASIINTADTTSTIAIRDYINATSYPSADYLIYCEPLLPDQMYQVRFDIAQRYPQIADSLVARTYEFTHPSMLNRVRFFISPFPSL